MHLSHVSTTNRRQQALTAGARCSGLTREANGQWMLRTGGKAQHSPTGEVSWLLRGLPSAASSDDPQTFRKARDKLVS